MSMEAFFLLMWFFFCPWGLADVIVRVPDEAACLALIDAAVTDARRLGEAYVNARCHPIDADVARYVDCGGM